MDKKKLDRISELSRKERSVGLSDDEKKEQKSLRDEYLRLIKKNFRQTLDNIEIVDKPLS